MIESAAVPPSAAHLFRELGKRGSYSAAYGLQRRAAALVRLLRPVRAAHARQDQPARAHLQLRPSRGRRRPAGHPATVAVREETLLDAVSDFFNRHIVGPNHVHLAQASIPAAAQHGSTPGTEAALDRRIAELDGALRNLTRALRTEQITEVPCIADRRDRRVLGNAATTVNAGSWHPFMSTPLLGPGV
jgi:hypothetical protein